MPKSVFGARRTARDCLKAAAEPKPIMLPAPGAPLTHPRPAEVIPPMFEKVAADPRMPQQTSTTLPARPAKIHPFSEGADWIPNTFLQAMVSSAGLTQAALAKLVDVPTETITAACSGRRRMGKEMSNRIACAIHDHILRTAQIASAKPTDTVPPSEPVVPDADRPPALIPFSFQPHPNPSGEPAQQAPVRREINIAHVSTVGELMERFRGQVDKEVLARTPAKSPGVHKTSNPDGSAHLTIDITVEGYLSLLIESLLLRRAPVSVLEFTRHLEIQQHFEEMEASRTRSPWELAIEEATKRHQTTSN